MTDAAEQHANDAANPMQADHGPGILSLPSNVWFTHMAPHVIGEVAALRTTCRMFRTNAAMVVAQSAQAASLHLSGQEPGGRELGAALGSALSQCQQPKHMCVSITGSHCPVSVLYGMQRSGAYQHVAALRLGHMWSTVPMMTDLADWPHLRSLKVEEPVSADVAFGASLAQLTRLQELGLKLQADLQQEWFSAHTLHGSHLQQLTQLTSLSLETPRSASALVGAVAGMPQLRKLDLKYASGSSSGELQSALPKLTALTSLDLESSSAAGPALLRAISGLPSLHHLGLPHCSITPCADALSGLTTLQSLRLVDGMSTDQEPHAAQLLSRLTRLEVNSWHGSGGQQQGRSSWLGQLKEVALNHVELPVLADLPAYVRIKQRAGRGQVLLVVRCRSDSTEQEVRDAVARLLNSPAVKDGKCVLSMGGLRPEQCAAIKPLAEAVPRVDGVTPQQLPLMAGWCLKRWGMDASSIAAPEMAQAAVDAQGLHVGALQVQHWERIGNGAAAAFASLQQLCQVLQGLKKVVVLGQHWVDGERQQVRQALQQAVQGRGVKVLLL